MIALTAAPLAQVQPRQLQWLWEPYLPLGKLVVLDGDPGVGKSLLTIDLAARLSRAGPLPDGAALDRSHTTLLFGAEDNAADTTRPRAEAAGADLERVVTVGGERGVPVLLPEMAFDLGKQVQAHGAGLVVFDPITAFLPAAGSIAGPQLRHVLVMLEILAERTGCTILLVRHLRKAATGKALYRGLGSIGLLATARTGLLVARHPSDPDLRVLTVTKTNMAEAAPSLGFRIRRDDLGRAAVEWAGRCDVTADAAGERPQAPLRPRDRACGWLQGELAGGPRRAADIYIAAAAAGIPERTLTRAKADVGIRSHRHTRNDGSEWYWFDLSAPWPANAPFPQPPDPNAELLARMQEWARL